MSLDNALKRPSRARCACSTIGFEHPAWNALYYPGNCPEEWRLAYFMNDFRAVYLPCTAWFESDTRINEIANELDEGFDLVVEWPPLVDVLAIESVLSGLDPIRQNIACVVLDIDAMSTPVLVASYQAIGKRYTLNFRSRELDTKARETLARQYETRFVWFPGQPEASVSGGSYQVVCLPFMSLRDMKSVLLQLRPLVERDIRIGLFFEPAGQSVFRAMEVRTLIELMGLA